MGWKYVVLETKSRSGIRFLFPVIFPDKLVHVEVATVMTLVVPGGKGKVRSAGKIEHVEVDGLGGDSESLKIGSHEDDEKLMNGYSYNHGIMS